MGDGLHTTKQPKLAEKIPPVVGDDAQGKEHEMQVGDIAVPENNLGVTADGLFVQERLHPQQVVAADGADDAFHLGICEEGVELLGAAARGSLHAVQGLSDHQRELEVGAQNLDRAIAHVREHRGGSGRGRGERHLGPGGQPGGQAHGKPVPRLHFRGAHDPLSISGIENPL